MKKPKFKAKIITLVLTLVTLAGGLVSCANPADYEKSAPDADVSSGGFGDAGLDRDGGVYSLNEQLLDENFVMQEPTDKLVLYTYTMSKSWVKPAAEIFRELYPEVNVIIHEIEDARDYELLMKHKLPSGHGPDLVVGQFTDFGGDYYRYMDDGVFMDLNQFLLRDEDFSLDGYMENIMDAGVYKGKRFVIPLEYSVPTLLTSEEVLAEEGLSAEDFDSFSSVIASVHSYNLKYQDSGDRSGFSLINSVSYMLKKLLLYSNVSIVDYENKKVAVDEENFRAIIDYVKDAPKTDNYDFKNAFAQGIVNRKSLFDDTIEELGSMCFMLMTHIDCYDMTPVTVLMPTVDGGVCANITNAAAIPYRSKNQVNAYRFLKILLSEEVQSLKDTGRYMPRYSHPVIESAARRKLIEAIEDDFYSAQLVEMLTEEDKQTFSDMAVDIDHATLGVPTSVVRIITESMTPYIEGEDSYESCYNALTASLEDYLN